MAFIATKLQSVVPPTRLVQRILAIQDWVANNKLSSVPMTTILALLKHVTLLEMDV